MSLQSSAIWRAGRAVRARAWIRFSAVAASALAATLAFMAPASASNSSVTGGGPGPAIHLLPLNAMPVGSAAFGRASRNRLTVSVEMYGLTPGSSHRVNLLSSHGYYDIVRFGTLTANSVGQARATLTSSYTGPWLRGTQLIVHMGTGHGSVARQRIAETGVLGRFTTRPHLFTSVEYSYSGISYGTPQGVATISYNSWRKTLTVTVNASGVTPGLHAAHIHLGSCMSQGPVKYMLKDLLANASGRIVHAVRVFTNVTTPIPASGWYLNIHQGNSNQILSNGNPTIYFRPLLCANIIGS